MAEILKRRHDLLALKVVLDAAGAEPRVCFALEASTQHVLHTEGEWAFAPGELGVPERVGRGEARGGSIPLRLPDRMVQEMRAVFDDGPPDALWLHLVRPYAHLGLAPWERVLTRALGVPVLRLPDFLVPPARESPLTLDVALCISRPRAKSPFDARSFVERMGVHVAGVVPRERVTVHLFTDADLYEELRSVYVGGGASFSSLYGQVQLWLHDPAGAARYADPGPDPARELSGCIDNPWLLWMRDTLRGHCLDLLHFACHGYYALDRGAVALASSPVQNDDEGLARFVCAAELETFLTQTGAWGAAFSSPPGNFSDIGLRHLADDLAQRKPFTTLYHDLAADPRCAQLADAWRFLFDPAPARPGPMDCISIYCQPSRITGEVPAQSTVPPPPVQAQRAEAPPEAAPDFVHFLGDAGGGGSAPGDVDRLSSEAGSGASWSFDGSGGYGSGATGSSGGSGGYGSGSGIGGTSGSSGGSSGYSLGSGLGDATGSSSGSGGYGSGSGLGDATGSSSGSGGYGSGSGQSDATGSSSGSGGYGSGSGLGGTAGSSGGSGGFGSGSGIGGATGSFGGSSGYGSGSGQGDATGSSGGSGGYGSGSGLGGAAGSSSGSGGFGSGSGLGGTAGSSGGSGGFGSGSGLGGTAGSSSASGGFGSGSGIGGTAGSSGGSGGFGSGSGLGGAAGSSSGGSGSGFDGTTGSSGGSGGFGSGSGLGGSTGGFGGGTEGGTAGWGGGLGDYDKAGFGPAAEGAGGAPYGREPDLYERIGPWRGDEDTPAAEPEAEAPAPSTVDAEATLTEVFATARTVPTWLAAAQRFVEGHAWQMRQWEQGTAPAGSAQQAELEATRETLAQIQEVLARHALAARAEGGQP